MKSTERHELRRNTLLDILSNPRELFRKYGLSILIIVLTASVAIYFIYRAAGSEQRKWQRAWLALESAVSLESQEQLRAIAVDTKSDPLIRSWAYIRYGELLYHNSQRPDLFTDRASRTELLDQADTAFQDTLQIGAKYREIVGQATIGLGLCYEDLGQPDKAVEQYESIISQADERFAGTVWLSLAQGRKAFLARLPDEKIVFGP